MAVATVQQQPPSAKDINGHPDLPQAALFGLPGLTNWSEQIENNDGTSLTLSQANQTTFQYSSNLINTDILYRLMVDVAITNTVTANAQTVTASQMFPYIFGGPTTLSMQSQFNQLDVENHFDAKLFELLRPQYNTLATDFWEQNPATNAYNAEANLSTASNYTSASGTIKYSLDIPMGMWFDRYFDLDADGQLRGNMGPMRAFVSPQLMAGATRVVYPRMLFNPAFASLFDAGPYMVTGGGTAATFTGSVVQGWTRKVIYQPRSHTDTPPLFGWQYSREAKRQSIAGRTTIDLLLPTTGQICGLFYRLFDPSASPSGGTGAPIALSNVKNVWLQYGSGLYKYQDTPLRAQRRFQRQHNNYIPPVGVIFHDLVVDEQGNVSNSNALNTLDTASCKVHFDFTGTTSSTAYVMIGVEALRWVAQQ